MVTAVHFMASRGSECVLVRCLTCTCVSSQVDNSSVIEIDFIRSDIFEEVLNYMYTAKISVKKKDVNLMMSSGQILGIRFLDKLCSQVTHTGDTQTGNPHTSEACTQVMHMQVA